MASPVVSSRTPVGQIINRDGTATFAFLKWMQNIGTTINVTFDSEGSYSGDISDQATIAGRATLASIVQNISTDGVVQGPGIDFALPYLNKNTDHIADGTGSPLAGGKAAYTALVASGPIAGQTIRFNGASWLPVAIAVSKVLVISQWLRSYDAATGTFTASQPAFSDISGTLTPPQLPADIAYKSQPNVFTANQTITGNLSVSGNITVPRVTASSDLTLEGAGNTWLNHNAGTGVKIGDGAGAQVASIDTAGNGTFNGTVTAGNGNLRLGSRAVSVPPPGSPVITGDSSNMVLDGAGPGGVFFNYDQGTGGTLFFNGSGGLVANINGAGAAVFSSLSVSGTKSFVVPHPLDETKELHHSCLEGPENGCYYRGRARTANDGYVTIFLPDYFEALVSIDDRSVLLTVIDDGTDNFPVLKSSEVSAGGFRVRSSLPDVDFYWEVKAIRMVGVDKLQVTQAKQGPSVPLPTPHESKAGHDD